MREETNGGGEKFTVHWEGFLGNGSGKMTVAEIAVFLRERLEEDDDIHLSVLRKGHKKASYRRPQSGRTPVRHSYVIADPKSGAK